LSTVTGHALTLANVRVQRCETRPPNRQVQRRVA